MTIVNRLTFGRNHNSATAAAAVSCPCKIHSGCDGGCVVLTTAQPKSSIFYASKPPNAKESGWIDEYQHMYTYGCAMHKTYMHRVHAQCTFWVWTKREQQQGRRQGGRWWWWWWRWKWWYLVAVPLVRMRRRIGFVFLFFSFRFNNSTLTCTFPHISYYAHDFRTSLYTFSCDALTVLPPPRPSLCHSTVSGRVAQSIFKCSTFPR